ncbi:hypothetical protein LINPERPRIM_LOCUS30201 [Linum perenne]
MCIRDSSGTVLRFRMSHRRGEAPAKEVEAAALLEALSWAEELNLPRVMFESDAKEVTDQVGASETEDTEFGEIIQQCRDIISRHEGFAISFVRRNGNMVAHTLARRSCSFLSPTVGVAPPDWLHELLQDYCVSTH